MLRRSGGIGSGASETRLHGVTDKIGSTDRARMRSKGRPLCVDSAIGTVGRSCESPESEEFDEIAPFAPCAGPLILRSSSPAKEVCTDDAPPGLLSPGRRDRPRARGPGSGPAGGTAGESGYGSAAGEDPG